MQADPSPETNIPCQLPSSLLLPLTEQYGYEHRAEALKTQRLIEVGDQQQGITTALKIERDRQAKEKEAAHSLGRLSAHLLGDHELDTIAEIASRASFRGSALQERWQHLCDPPAIQDDAAIHALDSIDVSEWMPQDRELQHQWQALLCKERDRFRGSVVCVHGPVSISYHMFVYATKKPLMPYWLDLEAIECLWPTVESAQADSYEECVSAVWAHRFRVAGVAVTPGSLCDWEEHDVDLAQEFFFDGTDYVSDAPFLPVSVYLPAEEDREREARPKGQRQGERGVAEEVLAAHPWLQQFAKSRSSHHRSKAKPWQHSKRRRLNSDESEHSDEAPKGPHPSPCAPSSPPSQHLDHLPVIHCSTISHQTRGFSSPKPISLPAVHNVFLSFPPFSQNNTP